MNAFQARLLRHFGNRSPDGSIECDESDTESSDYASVADWIVIESVTDRLAQKLFALPDIDLLQSVEKAIINVNEPVAKSPFVILSSQLTLFL